MQNGLTHFDKNGKAAMADVSKKEVTARFAVASGSVRMNPAAFEAIKNGTAGKGDVLGVARIAGIMAAKRTAEMIPCAIPSLSQVTVDFELRADAYAVDAVCTVRLVGQTGAEMEALTGTSVALLTIYDMCKALDRGMEITNIVLAEKDGGKSGHYVRHGVNV
jgi:cyclic pyranopterin phosphate synthase